jgi:tripartite ATP-independent transporter DctP family solute receptor
MKRNVKLLVFVCFIFLVLAGFTSEVVAKKLTFKITTISVDSAVESQGLHAFKKIVETSARQLGRDYECIVYTGGVLSKGKHDTETELLQKGSIQFQCASLPRLHVFEKNIGVFGLPFLFTTYNDQYRVYNSALAQELVRPLERANIKVLSFWRRPWRQLSNSKRAVVTPADIKGLKFRAPAIKMIVDTLNTLGAKPVVMTWGEVYSALQQGVIDGQDNGIDTTYSAKLYEVQDYFTIWNYMVDPIVIIVNNSWWNKLDDLDRSIIQTALIGTEETYFQMLLRSDEEKLEKLKKLMNVSVLTPEQIGAFRDAIKPVWKNAEEELGKDLLEKMGKLAQE